MVMKQNVIQILLVGSLRYHALPARGLARLLTKSESFSFISFPCNFFSASFVSNTRICHNKLCQIETLLTPGLTYQFGISASPSVVDQSSFKPFPIVFVLFLALEIFSLGTIIFFFTDWQQICPNEGHEPFAQNAVDIYPVSVFVFSFHSCSWVLSM